MFRIRFVDEVYRETLMEFTDWNETVKYWNECVNTETYKHGCLADLEMNEVIWRF